jgi:hypothetical protein
MSSEKETHTELEPPVEGVGELSHFLDPPRDLWPGIEARLRSRRAGNRRWGVVYQLAAAVALMVLGGALSQLLWPGLASGPGAADALLAAVSAEPAFTEAEYLRAKEALWLSAYGRRQDLSPATLRVVERNLKVIDEAIQELRQALAEDPGNHHLAGLLYANHRRSIHLLQRLAQVPEEV